MAKILLIVSKANPDIASRQLQIAQTELHRRAVKYDLIQVPQPIDLLPSLAIAFDAEDYEGIVACGVIIGSKPQHLIVYQECLRGMHSISLDFASPIGCGIVHGDDVNSAAEELEVITTEAIISCLEIMKLKEDLQAGNDERRFKYQN